MAGCTYRHWGSIKVVGQHRACPANCAKCDQVQVVQVVNRDPELQLKSVETSNPVRRQIKDCCKQQTKAEHRELEPTPCRPLRTSLHTKPLTTQSKSRPPYKHSIFLDDNTSVGRVFPIKFCLRRRACKCLECSRELAPHETVASNDDLLLLSNCCHVEITPRKVIENWDRVPVAVISKLKHVAKSYIMDRPDPVSPPNSIPLKPIVPTSKKTEAKSKNGIKGKQKKKKRKKK